MKFSLKLAIFGKFFFFIQIKKPGMKSHKSLRLE